MDRRHRIYRTPAAPACSQRVIGAKAQMKGNSYLLSEHSRRAVVSAICDVCRIRGWYLHALHVRSNHWHAVVRADRAPELVMTAFKANASRILDAVDRRGKARRWARRGSARYLWTMEQVEAAVDYVLHQQGEPMETYPVMR